MKEQARAYNRLKIRLKLIDLFFLALYLLLFQAFLSGPLKSLAVSAVPSIYFSFTLYLFAFCIFGWILGFPLHFYASFILEHKFRLSNQGFFAWLKDDIKRGAISFFVFVVFMQALYLFIRNFQTTWWIWIALFWFLTTVFLAQITPTFIIPLFFKYYPVGEELKQKIIALSKKCGVKILDVYKIDFSRKTRKLNAALTGIGRTKRVILADNLINEFTDEEIEGVLAHEFGHHKLLHIWKLIIFGFAVTFISFYALSLLLSEITILLKAENLYDMAIFPSVMLVLFVAGFLMMPAQNAFSRKLERDADLFALKATKNKKAFISLMNKLSDRNLADPHPMGLVKIFFYDHPPISERIKLAEDFK